MNFTLACIIAMDANLAQKSKYCAWSVQESCLLKSSVNVNIFEN